MFHPRPLLPLLALAAILAGALPAGAEPVPVSGRVAGEDGRPLAGARLALSRPVPECAWTPDGAAPEGPAAVAAAGPDGRFTLAAPEPGIWRLTAEAPGHVARERLLAPLLEPIELETAVLPRDAGLTIQVAGPAGPVAARVLAVPEVRPASISLSSTDPDSGWRAPARRAAGPAGPIRLPWSAGERLRLAAAAPGLVPTELAALEARVAGTDRLALTTGPVRALRAVDERGAPVAGAVVCSQDGLALGGTDAAGRWSGAVRAAGSLALKLRGPDGLQGSLRLAGPSPMQSPRKSPAESPAESVARLRRPALLAGRVLAGEDRRPLAGALVWIEGAPEGAVRTGRDGGYALPVAGVDLPGYHLRAAAAGYLPAYALLAAPGGRGPTLLLERSAAVSGTVVDPAGRPVAAAELALVPDPGQDPGFSPLRSGIAGRSGPDGRFRLAGAPDQGRFTLFCRKPGFAPARLTLDLAAARQPLRVVLAAGRSAVGRVVDPAGEPAAGARVALRPGFAVLSSFEETGAEWTAEADAAGRFRLTGLPAGRFDLEAAAPGFARTLLPNVQIPAPALDDPPGKGPAEVDLGTVSLLPGLVLTGQVVDRAGKPLAGTDVEVMQLPLGLRRPLEPLHAASGPDGGFRLADLSPGYALHLTFRKPGYERRMVQEVILPALAPITPLRVVLAPAGRIRGRVLDAERQPVAGAQVLVESPTDGTAGQSPTDGAGEFEATEVAPGTATLHVQAAGFLAARLAGLEVPAGGELAGVEVVLERGAVIEGRVTDPRGRPVPGATVLARDASGGERLTGGLAFGLSDGDGSFHLAGVPAGLATLEAQHPRFGRARTDLEVRPGSNAATLVFSPVFEVAGRVIDGAGRPVAGVNVSLQGGDSGDDTLGPSGTVTAEDGTFVLPAVMPGTYVLLAVLDGFELAAGLPVEVRDGPLSGLEMRIERGSAVLRGRLVGLAPDELARVQVHASGEGRALLGWVRPDGTYTVEGLAAGAWSIAAFLHQVGSAGGARQARGEVELPAGAAGATLDLVFEEEPEDAGFTVTGLVRRAGAPVSGAMVVVEGRTASTDGSGAFRLTNVPAGSHQLVVQLQSGLLHQETLEVAEDRSVVVEIAAGRLAGRVVEAAGGQPLPGAQVRWQPLDGLPAGSDPATFWGGIESDARGLFFAEVTPGRFRVVAERRGYAAAEVEVEVGEGAASEVEIRLEPAEVLVLALAHADGRPLGQVTLAALDGAGRVVASGRFKPGTDGRVRVSTVPAGTWQLLAVADGSGTAGLAATVPGEAGPLLLPPAGSLTVQAPELADQAAVVTLADAAGRPVQLLDEWSEQVAASWPLLKGAAALGGVAAGRYTATVTAGDGRTSSKAVEVAPGGQAALVLP